MFAAHYLQHMILVLRDNLRVDYVFPLFPAQQRYFIEHIIQRQIAVYQLPHPFWVDAFLTGLLLG